MLWAREDRWKSGWWNEWRSREKEQRIAGIDVIQLVFARQMHAQCRCLYNACAPCFSCWRGNNYWFQGVAKTSFPTKCCSDIFPTGNHTLWHFSSLPSPQPRVYHVFDQINHINNSSLCFLSRSLWALLSCEHMPHNKWYFPEMQRGFSLSCGGLVFCRHLTRS